MLHTIPFSIDTFPHKVFAFVLDNSPAEPIPFSDDKLWVLHNIILTS
jgi:hypothetical protein